MDVFIFGVFHFMRGVTRRKVPEYEFIRLVFDMQCVNTSCLITLGGTSWNFQILFQLKNLSSKCQDF